MFKPGDKIWVKNPSSHGLEQGEIDSQAYFPLVIDDIWYVKLPNSPKLLLYTTDELLIWNIPSVRYPIYGPNCVCGAESAYAPNKPPGHAHYCKGLT